jgi:alpha-galactosidase/6-phospho-beta-glucosidase family protein
MGPRVVLIGAGSAFFGRQTICSMVTKEALNSGTLVLVDVDEKILKTMEQVAQKAIATSGAPLKLEVATDYRTVLKGTDFVILAFAVEGVKLRGIDSDVSTRHGMVMCSGDTIGPGGTMRTLREVPRQHAMMQEIEQQCPDAWVINWVNPSCAMGIAMMRHFPNIRSLAICDGPHNPRFEDDMIVKAGIVESAEAIDDALRAHVKIRCGGINHFTWLVEMTHQNVDVLPRVIEALKSDMSEEHHAAAEDGKRNNAAAIAYQLASSVGYVPTCVWHTMEYLPFFQGRDVDSADALAISQWSEKVRWDWMEECWNDMEKIASGERETTDFLENTEADHASNIIESMWAGSCKRFYINTPNRGAVTNMCDDAFLEIPCVLDMNGVYPLHFGEMPRPISGWCQHLLDEHELAVEAAITCDRTILRRAFLASMLAQSIPDVDRCVDELLAAERDYLPAAWF